MNVRLGPLIGSFVFFWIAPVTVAGGVPYLLTRWRIQPPFFGVAAGRIVGGVVVTLGLAALLECVGRFAIKGRGTPAPIAPTKVLVATGLFRYVRNPMYLGVVAIISGQALLLGSVRLLGYAGIVWLLFHGFVLVYEEPTLRRQFGSSYEVYRASVPRWCPRTKGLNSRSEP